MRSVILRLTAPALASAVVLIALVASPAAAHAYLVSSNPVDGSRLESAPPRMELSFSEHVVAQATRITVVDTSGHVERLTDVHLVSQDATDTEEPATIVATFARPLPEAAYRVSWETLSSDDLHRTAGVFVFGIGRTVRATAVAESAPALDEATLRGGFLLGLALLLGGLLAERVLRRTAASVELTRRLATWGGALALAMSVLLLVNQVVRAHSGLPPLVFSSYGGRWLVRTLGLGVLVAGVRTQPSARRSRQLWLGTAITCLGTASLGHAASGTLSPTRLLADATHIAATLSWGGAVICLAAALLNDRGQDRRAGLGITLRAFAVPAAACLSVAVVTGFYLSSWVVGSVDAALLTVYGKVLLLKLAVVGAAAGLGLVNHLRLRHGSDVRLPRLTVPTEACAVVGAVLLTAVLTSSQPATEPAYTHPGQRADSAPVDGRLADLQVSAGIRPNRPGPAVAVVDVFDTRRPAPAPITRVVLDLEGRPPVELHPIGSGQWSGAVTASGPGSTSLHVRVSRVGQHDVVGRFSWTVGGGPLWRPATVSQAPAKTWLRSTSAGLGALLVMAWSGTLVIRRRRGRPGPSSEVAQPIEVGAGV